MARKVYVLTEDGTVKGVTFDHSKAENWMGLGNMYDYFPMVVDKVLENDQQPESARQQPDAAQQRTQDIIERQKEVQKRLDKRLKRVSPLLKDPYDTI